MVGTTLGKYRIDAEISRGGMGTICRATHVETGRVAAVKILQPALAADHVFLQRFRREVRALQQVNHPNVIEVYDVGSEGDVHYFAMEFLERSLADLLRGGALAPRRALQIARQIAQGLEAAHAAGIFHRDIKPANILFASDGCAKVSDFGIAKVGEATRMTQTGTIVGTPAYMSPEQAEGPEVDARADVYSLGVVLYEMATGRVPFDGRSALDVLRKHRFSLPEAPKTLNPQLPAALSNLILQMLEKVPGKRPPTMTFLAAAFERLEQNLASEADAYPSAPPQEAPRPRRPSDADFATSYEQSIRRLVTLGKRLAVAAALALVVYVAYRVDAYQRRGPGDYLHEAAAAEASDEAEAVSAYEALVKRFPDSDEAAQARERLEAIRKRREAAARPKLELLPQDNTPALRAQIAFEHFRRAQEEADQGRIDHAIAIYKMIREQFADTPWAPRADARLQALEAAAAPKPATQAPPDSPK